MALSSDLISQFVKVTKDEVNTKKETTTYGTIITDGENKYVQLDGSNLLTPFTTTTAVKEGDRVLVTVKDHSAIITGNTTSPSANNDSIEEVNKKISEFDTIVADKVSTGELEAEIAVIEKLITDEFSATNAKIENIVVDTGKINELEAEIIVVNQKITAHEGEFTTIKGDIADFKELTAGNFEATNANIHNLQADYAEFEQTVTNKLEAQDAEIENLDVKYANIDFSNIDIVTMGKFFADSGVIENVVIKDGQVTGVLAGVTIKGDLIEGGTVVADKLVILGDDGLYYKLNTNGETVSSEQTEYNSLSGTIITAKSVTADKIAVTDLVAFGATIGGFHIGDHSLYSGVKGTVHNTINGIYMDDEGQISIGDNKNFIKYYKDENGEYHLELAASTIKMESNKTIQEYITEELQNIEIDIGTRNYALDSDRETSLYNFGAGSDSTDGYRLIDSFKNCFGTDYYAISGEFKYVPQASVYGSEIVIEDAAADPIHQIAIIGSSELIGEPSIDNPAEINIIDSITISSNTTTLELDLTGYELMQGDALIIENNHAMMHKYSKKLVLNGTENWILDSGNDNYISVKLDDLNISSDMPTSRLCDKLPSEYYEDVSQLTTECNWCRMDGLDTITFGIIIRKDRLSTPDVEGVKAWLNNNNIILCYPTYSSNPGGEPVDLGETNIQLLDGETNTITSSAPISIVYNQNVYTEENSVGSFWFEGWDNPDDYNEEEGPDRLKDINSSKWNYTDMEPGKYKRFGFVAKLSEDAELDTFYIGMACDNLNGTLYLKNIIVEKGSITSDWTPAPEDMGLELNSTITQMSSLEERYDTIVASVTESKRFQEVTTNALGEVNKNLATLEQSVSAAITSEDLTIAVKKELDNGVSKVTTSTGFTFDEDGLTISKSGSEMATNVDEDGLSVYRNNEEVLTADSTGVRALNLYANNFNISDASMFEKFERNSETRIGCFWID